MKRIYKFLYDTCYRIIDYLEPRLYPPKFMTMKEAIEEQNRINIATSIMFHQINAQRAEMKV